MATIFKLSELEGTELKKNFRVPVFEYKKFKEYKYFKLGEQVDDVSYSEQCIGMKDKNGNPIYVNDILKYVYSNNNTSIIVLEWGIKFMFGILVNNEPIGLDTEPLNPEEVEIIGNYWENPELCQSSENKERIK